MQIFLGAGSYLMSLATKSSPQAWSTVVANTTAHVAVGALLLASSVFLTFNIHRYVATLGSAGVEEISVEEART